MIKHVNGKQYVFLVCQKIEQPIGTLFTSAMRWQTLKHVSYIQEHMLVVLPDSEEKQYVGIQRQLSKERQKDIATYVNKDNTATFPSSIILNIPFGQLDIIQLNPSFQLQLGDVYEYANPVEDEFMRHDVKLGTNKSYLFIFPYEENTVQIIDGQHRMSGFENSSDDLEFELPVTIFVDQIIESQAEIFATINGKQTRVTPSLVYDLFGMSLKRSPYKVVHELIRLLNTSSLSPLRGWIKTLGKSNEYFSGYITQSTIAKNILPLICGNIKQAEEDKRQLASGNKISLAPTETSKDPVLRSYFYGEEDEVTFKILINFFTAVSARFSVEWNTENSILRKTVGVTALFRLFDELARIGKAKNNLTQEFFYTEISSKQMPTFRGIQLSSKGVNQLLGQFNQVEA